MSTEEKREKLKDYHNNYRKEHLEQYSKLKDRIEELEEELESIKEEYENFKQEVEDNYRPVGVAEQIDYNEDW